MLDMRDRVEDLSESIGVRVRVISENSELLATSEEGKPLYNRRERRAKGWWDADSGEVVIVLPNNVNVADVDNTFVHEVVGHYGLRALIGEERFDGFLDEVYGHAGKTIRKEIDKKAAALEAAEADRLRTRKAREREATGEDVNAHYYGDMAEAQLAARGKRAELRREATEEYMAELGGRIGSEGFERMDREELTLWGKIKAKVQAFLEKLLRGLRIAKSVVLTDKDLAYILYKSWANLRERRGQGGVSAAAEDAVMRHRTGWEAGMETGGKRARIEKLRHSEAVVVKEEMLPAGLDLRDRKAVKAALKERVRGSVVNEDTGATIEVYKDGINEVTSHGMTVPAHVKSLFAIPEMLRKSIYIDERRNEKAHTEFEKYQYYVCGLKIDGEDYTAKIVIGVKGEERYYDHRLTQIEKGKLIDSLNGLSNSEAANELSSDGHKGTTLETLLQISEEENAEGRRYRYGEAGMERASVSLEEANRRFNSQLQRYINGEMSTQEYVELGIPLGAMKKFLTAVPIVVRQRVLHKASETKHNIELRVLQNLPSKLAEPIFVFQRDAKTLGVLTELKDRDGKNVCVAIELNRTIQSGSEVLEVNDIRSLHGRDIANIVLPIVHNNTLRYADKEKGLAWLSSASSNYQQEIASQDLDTAAKIIENFENPKFEEEENAEGRRYRDGDMGLEEYMSRLAAEAAAANAGDLAAKREAMRVIGGNLNRLRQAMARQREYDVTTVKSVTDLARVLLDANLLDDLSKWETKRLLGAIKNAVGREDVSASVEKVLDLLVDNQLRMGRNEFGRLLSIRGGRVDARGVEVQGTLDAEGQQLVQVVKRAITLPKADIEARMTEVENRMGSDDSAIAEAAAAEYAGLQIAHNYAEAITESKAEEQALRAELRDAEAELKLGGMDKSAFMECRRAMEEAIRENKTERAEAYRALSATLGGALSESVERAKAWREGERARVEEIHHNANSDMEGRPADEHHKESGLQKLSHNRLVRFALAPLATFDQMLRMFGNKNTRGEGYLWNRYMRGWVQAAEKEYTGYRDAVKILDAKVKEVFKDYYGRTLSILSSGRSRLPRGRPFKYL